jgi:hypothetical protein
MIQGYFSPAGTTRRPFVQALLQFPSRGPRQVTVELLVDTGADRTMLGPVDARRFRIAPETLPSGAPAAAWVVKRPPE